MTKLQFLRNVTLTVLLTCVIARPASCSADESTNNAIAAVSPDSTCYVSSLSDGHSGVLISSTDASLNVPVSHLSGQIRGFVGLDIATVWSADSSEVLVESNSAKRLYVYDKSGRNVAKLDTPGGVFGASFSPDGSHVAFTTFDSDSMTKHLCIWRISATKTGITIIVPFPDDVEGFCWVDNSSLFVYTPQGYRPDLEEQNFYIVDSLAGTYKTISNQTSSKLVQTWPYADSTGKILALLGADRLFAKARLENLYRLVQIDPATGFVHVICNMGFLNGRPWWPLCCDKRSVFAAVHSYSGTILTRQIDCKIGSIGPVVEWAVQGDPSVDSSGRLFGYVNGTPRFANVVK